MPVCTNCNGIKLRSEFYNCKVNKSGMQSWCKDCKQLAAREYMLQKEYGIGHDGYQQLLDRQDGSCAICGSKESKGRSARGFFHVDHCHETGKIRGLLCHPCNVALGMMNDDPARLRLAIRYLENRD